MHFLSLKIHNNTVTEFAGTTLRNADYSGYTSIKHQHQSLFSSSRKLIFGFFVNNKLELKLHLNDK